MCVCVSPMLDQSAEEAAWGRQIKGRAQVTKGVWPGLECDDLDVEEVGELNERRLTWKRRRHLVHTDNPNRGTFKTRVFICIVPQR